MYFKNHIKLMHLKERVFSCKYCDDNFGTKFNKQNPY